jgi:hypothetical protein
MRLVCECVVCGVLSSCQAPDMHMPRLRLWKCGNLMSCLGFALCWLFQQQQHSSSNAEQPSFEPALCSACISTPSAAVRCTLCACGVGAAAVHVVGPHTLH